MTCVSIALQECYNQNKTSSCSIGSNSISISFVWENVREYTCLDLEGHIWTFSDYWGNQTDNSSWKSLPRYRGLPVRKSLLVTTPSFSDSLLYLSVGICVRLRSAAAAS